MGSGFSIRARRRTAAQQLALLQVKREISATDPHGRLKYVRDFSEAFRDYRRALNDSEFKQQCSTADVLLVGDYHALAASQDYTASLLGQLVQSDRPVVLALEMAFSRDQYVLDEWLRGEISEDELRAGIRYDDEWGYDWEPFATCCARHSKHGCPVYGIDLKPRGNMRKIAARDRHAADADRTDSARASGSACAYAVWRSASGAATICRTGCACCAHATACSPCCKISTSFTGRPQAS